MLNLHDFWYCSGSKQKSEKTNQQGKKRLCIGNLVTQTGLAHPYSWCQLQAINGIFSAEKLCARRPHTRHGLASNAQKSKAKIAGGMQ
jgi:hypothetical protein